MKKQTVKFHSVLVAILLLDFFFFFHSESLELLPCSAKLNFCEALAEYRSSYSSASIMSLSVASSGRFAKLAASTCDGQRCDEHSQVLAIRERERELLQDEMAMYYIHISLV